MESSPRPQEPSRPVRPRRRRLRRILGIVLLVPTLVAAGIGTYYYFSFARVIDERLRGERVRTLPRVFARPFEVRRGQWLGPVQIADRLNDLGYANRPALTSPGEFTATGAVTTLHARGGSHAGKIVRIICDPGGGGAAGMGSDASVRTGVIERIEIDGEGPVESVRLEPPLLTALITANREKRRRVSLALIPRHMVQAVLAIEDRRFYEHPGIDPIRIVGAIITNVRGDKPYLVGASTITQQLVKNFFLTPEKSIRRKLLEQFMAVVLETRATKDEILELYLNDVYLGQRGSFAVHGVAEAARLFFGKDVTNLTLAEAATIAGVIQAPYTWSPFTSPTRSMDRRNVVLQAMVDAGFTEREAAERAGREPVAVVRQALDVKAPYFVDYLGQTLSDQYPGLLGSTEPVDVFTTIDINLQRIAQAIVEEGIAQVDKQLVRKRVKGRPQVALIAVDPRTGDLLAFVGGRSYIQSQYNRAFTAKRQPGSVFKPFVYLAAFEEAAAQERTDLTPATLVDDEQTTFTYEDKQWTPSNYEDEYDGPITLRRAIAMSRNVATIRVAELTGFGAIADLWKRVGTSTVPRPYPSITLGVFEATPMEIAMAYTVFPNGGELRPIRALTRITNGSAEVPVQSDPPRRIARPDTSFLVTNLMRSVINEGTGASARAMGFALDAAGKTGTTNDMRDAWFVGFTPELLTAVWVGFDDNQPLELSGSTAALPIWTRFMMAALSGRPNVPFAPPDGIVFVEIDRDTGALAQPACPRVFREAFLAGTEPVDACELHRF